MRTSRIVRDIVLLPILTFCLFSANAQNEEDFPPEYRTVESIVPGAKDNYRCYKYKASNQALYIGTRYNEEMILNEYPSYIDVDLGFLGYKTNVHDVFVGIVREAVGMEKVRTLAGRNEQLYVGFDLDQNGKILMIYFWLDTTTLITTDELYTMEELIKVRFSFVPIRRTSVKLRGGFGIRTTFSEILTGEIPSLKRKELRQRETEADFGD
ncbi:MAG: hypothetical protein RBS81_11165 [Tenuifilaceae bacterium]|jgi:hypothetical protein|nr:hypothetical protein [Tenuifilaceae bacterium]